MFQKGRAKTGGRQKGTPNKTPSPVREVIAKALNEYYNSDTFLADIEALEPRDRVAAMERLTAYSVPKLQSVNLDAVVERKKNTIEDKLINLSGDSKD
ncbi:MAG: hypothetical protein J6V00_05430 [Bacteroidaceae bacterium]|nr:hypothetical protein [Bacteroidaceae bacterium]